MPTSAAQISAAQISEAARNVAREHDRHPVRAAKSTPPAPTIERAAPAPTHDRGLWASGNPAGGSPAGSGTLRIFALATMTTLPFALPRTFRAPMRSSLVPTGELGLSLPERPG